MLKDLLRALGETGPWAPFWIALADSAFLPLAQTVDLLIVAAATTAPGLAYRSAFMAAAGSTLGCLASFAAARFCGARILNRYVSEARLAKLSRSFDRHGALALILPVMTPAPLPVRLFVWGAGALRMSPLKFVAAVGIARAIRYAGIAFVTLAVQEPALRFLTERFWLISGLLIVSVPLVLLFWRRRTGSTATRTGRRFAAGRGVLLSWSAKDDDQPAQGMALSPSGRLSQGAPLPARAEDGCSRPAFLGPSDSGAPDSRAALQPFLRLLQRI
jgi:membrane protein YqaA with SNARE-associated domain